MRQENRQEEILEQIRIERTYQNTKWGTEFDKKNTPNDWMAYIASYLGKALTYPFNRFTFSKALIKVAALCVAALEQDSYAKRHYDAV